MVYHFLQKFAQQTVQKISLDRLLQDNFDYNILWNTLPEVFFDEAEDIAPHFNFKGALCVDLGHKETIYGYALPQDIRFHPENNFPIKIGMTQKEEKPIQRIWKQNTLPEYPQILFMITVPNAALVEKSLHKFYNKFERSKALGIEWFDLSAHQVIETALWMSVLSCMTSFMNEPPGVLVEQSRNGNWKEEDLFYILERERRLKEVRKCLEAIDKPFKNQGTNFKIGYIDGIDLGSSSRPQKLTSNLYEIKLGECIQKPRKTRNRPIEQPA